MNFHYNFGSNTIIFMSKKPAHHCLSFNVRAFQPTEPANQCTNYCTKMGRKHDFVSSHSERAPSLFSSCSLYIRTCVKLFYRHKCPTITIIPLLYCLFVLLVSFRMCTLFLYFLVIVCVCILLFFFILFPLRLYVNRKYFRILYFI